MYVYAARIVFLGAFIFPSKYLGTETRNAEVSSIFLKQFQVTDKFQIVGRVA